MKAVIADDESHLATHLQDRLSALWPEWRLSGLLPTASRRGI